jgi:hypothetical protein
MDSDLGKETTMTQEFRLKRPVLNEAAKRALAASSQAAAAAGTARLERMRGERRQQSETGTALKLALEQLMQREEGTRRILNEMRDHPLLSPLAEKPFDVAPNGSIMSIELSRHTSLADPPFDGQWNWGNSYGLTLNPATGQMIIHGASGDVSGAEPGPVDAAGGLDLVITTDRRAIIEVRPLLKCRWRWLNESVGLFSSAESRGGVETAIFDGPNMMTPVLRTTQWSSRVAPGLFDGRESSSGEDSYAFLPWQGLQHQFEAEANRAYVLKIGLWVQCDHSSGIGVAAGQAAMDATIHWVAIERWVAG